MSSAESRSAEYSTAWGLDDRAEAKQPGCKFHDFVTLVACAGGAGAGYLLTWASFWTGKIMEQWIKAHGGKKKPSRNRPPALKT